MAPTAVEVPQPPAEAPQSMPKIMLSHDITTKPLLANDGLLAPSDLAPLRPSAADTPLDELRRRYETDGYVFVKGVIPREDVLKCREAYFKFLEPTGVLKPGTPPVAGIFDAAKSPDDFPGVGASTVRNSYGHVAKSAELFLQRALQAHYEPWYAEEFCKHPALLEFVRKFSGWGEDMAAFQRTLLRNNIPNTKAIGVHYDQIFLRHGEPTAITAWVPIGDIKVKGGGLIYLENSHAMGAEIEAEFFAKATAAGFSEDEARYAFNNNMMESGLLADGAREFAREHKRRWLVADYEAGDIVLHNPFMIHASTRNEDDNNVIRLATDLRFANTARKWDTRWMKHYEVADGL